MTRQARRQLVAFAALALATGCGTRVDRSSSATSAAQETAALPSGANPPEQGPIGGVAVPGPPLDTGAGGSSDPRGPTVTTLADSVRRGAASPDTAARPAAPGSRTAAAPDSGAPGSANPGTPPGTDPSPAAPELPRPSRNKAPIVIGNVGTWSGPLGSSTAEAPRALRVWARWINDRGGINGHQVQVISADDGGDTGRHDALVQDMVENRKVIAFVVNWYFLNPGRTPTYLREKRIPVVGGDLVHPVWYTEPLFFPQGGSVEALIYGVARAAVTAGKGKVGVTWCAEAVACRTAKDTFAAALKRLGGTIVHDSQISLAQPDFTAECLSMQRAGAQSVWVFSDANTLGRSARSCSRQGYRPQYLAGLATQTDTLPQVPELNGLLGAVNLVPWFATTGAAGIKEYRDALTRYAADIRPGADVAIGWVAGKLFERAAQHVGDIPTSADIIKGLWQIHNDDLGGITVPLNFIPDRPAPRSQCWVPTEIRNNRWVAPTDGRPICDPGAA